MDWRTAVKERLTIRRLVVREALAEFIGTFVMIVFGLGSTAQFTFGRGLYGEFLSVNMCWGVGVTMGVFFSGNVSGGHINPAVTFTLAMLGFTPWIKVPVYMLAQYLGAFAGSACVYAIYYDALNHFDGGIRQMAGVNGTAAIWATYPQEHVTTVGCFVDQIFGTALIIGCILAIVDPSNMAPPAGLQPFLIGLVVYVVGAAYSYNCGCPINPARDLSPRLFTLIAGWGTATFSVRNYNYFWVPIVGPHIGGLLGAILYALFVGLHWPEDSSSEITYRSMSKDIKGERIALLKDSTSEMENDVYQ